MKTKLLIWVAILSIGSMSRVQAQSDVDVSLKSDFVSDYNWRGLDLGNASIQPELSVGWKGLSLTAWGKSDYYDVGGFSVTYLSLSATKDIQITKSFALPLFGQVIANPASQNFYFVFGFTVKVL